MGDHEAPNDAARRAEEEAELRARDDKRRKEDDDRRRRSEAEKLEEGRRAQQEKLRRLEEERQRLKKEEELKRLGSDKIIPLPPVPPSTVDDNDPLSMKAWFLDDEVSKPTLRQVSLKNGKRPGAPPVTLAQLREIGVVYFRVNLNDFGLVNQIVKERCYKHVDEVKLSQTCKDEAFLDRWYSEHFNEDENIRLITDGSCFFDIRSKADTWIRLHCNAGDLIVLPPGLYMRGTLDEADFCGMMRVFRDAQRYNPIFRSEKRADSHPARVTYQKSLKKGNVAVDIGFK